MILAIAKLPAFSISMKYYQSANAIESCFNLNYLLRATSCNVSAQMICYEIPIKDTGGKVYRYR